jgi:hypothetical protein
MSERLRIFALFCGCVLFGTVIFLELDPGPAGEKTVIATPDPLPAAHAGHPHQMRQFENLVRVILARPLFSPTRRPSDDSGGRDEALVDLSGTRLTGIITLPSLRIAIFARDGKKPVALTEGDSVGAWRIEKITPTTVALRGPGGARELAPKSDRTLPRTSLPGAFGASAGGERAGVAAAPGTPPPPFRLPVPGAPRARPWR